MPRNFLQNLLFIFVFCVHILYNVPTLSIPPHAGYIPTVFQTGDPASNRAEFSLLNSGHDL